jgi:hypothetical protein
VSGAFGFIDMAIAIVVAALVIIALNVWAGVVVFFGRFAGTWLRVAYFLVLLAAGIAAGWTTGWEYYSNENTRIVGWPVPVVIFQRDDANAPWLDFVGPTTVFGYPMNLAIFMSVPSALFLGLVHWRKWIGAKRAAEPSAPVDRPGE